MTGNKFVNASDKDQKAEDFSSGWDVGVDALEELSNLVEKNKAKYEGMLLMGALAVFLECIYKAVGADDADEMIQNAMEFSRNMDHGEIETEGTMH